MLKTIFFFELSATSVLSVALLLIFILYFGQGVPFYFVLENLSRSDLSCLYFFRIYSIANLSFLFFYLPMQV